MWMNYVTDVAAEHYPDPLEDPGNSPNYGTIGTPLGVAKSKDTYANKNKNFQEDANMNCALTERFLSIFALKHSQAYYNVLIEDPG